MGLSQQSAQSGSGRNGLHPPPPPPRAHARRPPQPFLLLPPPLPPSPPHLPRSTRTPFRRRRFAEGAQACLPACPGGPSTRPLHPPLRRGSTSLPRRPVPCLPRRSSRGGQARPRRSAGRPLPACAARSNRSRVRLFGPSEGKDTHRPPCRRPGPVLGRHCRRLLHGLLRGLSALRTLSRSSEICVVGPGPAGGPPANRRRQPAGFQ